MIALARSQSGAGFETFAVICGIRNLPYQISRCVCHVPAHVRCATSVADKCGSSTLLTPQHHPSWSSWVHGRHATRLQAPVASVIPSLCVTAARQLALLHRPLRQDYRRRFLSQRQILFRQNRLMTLEQSQSFCAEEALELQLAPVLAKRQPRLAVLHHQRAQLIHRCTEACRRTGAATSSTGPDIATFSAVACRRLVTSLIRVTHRS